MMLRSSVPAAVCLQAVVAAILLVACSATQPAADQGPPPPAGVARVAVAPYGGRPEIAVTSVVPWPGRNPWNGATVMLDYSRLTGDVDLERSSLWVDGRRRPARVTWTALTPVSYVVVFTWRWPCRPGTHTLRAHLGTTGGGSVAYEWTTVTR
jgi:hypothetical protein